MHWGDSAGYELALTSTQSNNVSGSNGSACNTPMLICVDLWNSFCWMNPRSISEVLALMTPDRAEHTVELADRAKTSPKDPSANLPKIEGHPTGQ